MKKETEMVKEKVAREGEGGRERSKERGWRKRGRWFRKRMKRWLRNKRKEKEGELFKEER